LLDSNYEHLFKIIYGFKGASEGVEDDAEEDRVEDAKEAFYLITSLIMIGDRFIA